MPSTERAIPELLSQGSGSPGRCWAGGVQPSGLSQWIPFGQVLPYFLRLCPKVVEGSGVDGRGEKVPG